MAGEQRESWWLETSRGVGGWSPGERVGGWSPREAVGGRRAELVAGPERELVAGPERGVAAGDHGGQLRLDKREANREVGVEERRGSQHQTPSREARRQDRVQ